MKVERPFAYCCAEGGGRVEHCDCANKNHGTAWLDAPATQGVGDKLLATAKLLYANAVACAQDHYGEDFYLHGMPGWLSDCLKDIEAAAALAPSPSVGEEKRP